MLHVHLLPLCMDVLILWVLLPCAMLCLLLLGHGNILLPMLLVVIVLMLLLCG